MCYYLFYLPVTGEGNYPSVLCLRNRICVKERSTYALARGRSDCLVLLLMMKMIVSSIGSSLLDNFVQSR